MKTVFANRELQDRFDEYGFVKLPKLIGEGEIDYLLQLFREKEGQRQTYSDFGKQTFEALGMYVFSQENEDIPLLRELSEKILETVFPRLEPFLQDCAPLHGNFIFKNTGPFTATPPHQDWTLVDIDQGPSLTLWLPFVNADNDNGTLGCIPKSHRFFSVPSGAPNSFRGRHCHHRDLLYQYLQFTPVKAGEGIIFNNLTVHGATANTSGKARAGIQLTLIHKTAQLCHYFQLPGSEEYGRRRIAQLKVDESFFLHYCKLERMNRLYDEGKLPFGYPVQKIIEDTFVPLTVKEFENWAQKEDLVRYGTVLPTPNL